MTRVLIAARQQLFLLGIGQLIDEMQGMEVVGRARSGSDAIRLAREIRPDLVILDIALEGLNGIDAARRISASYPKPKVLCIAQRSDAKLVAAAWRAGATGYVLKNCSLEEFQQAVRILLAQGTYVSPAVAGSLVGAAKSARDPASSVFSVLTEREREVLQWLAEGQSASELADQLCISTKTVHTHRKNIMEKLHIRRFANLVKYAIQEGLTSEVPAENYGYRGSVRGGSGLGFGDYGVHAQSAMSTVL